MFQLGNTFGKKSMAQTEKIQSGRSVTSHGAQEALDRANKAYNVKTAELAEARSRLTELDQNIGEKIADGGDATAEVLARQSAQSLVTQLESAVAVLLQRKQETEAAFKKATMVEKREALRAKLQQLADLGSTVDAQMAENGRLAAEAIHVISEIRSFSCDGINKRLVDAVLLFRVKLLDTCEKMPGCWTGADLFKKREPWSACLPTPDQADQVKG